MPPGVIIPELPYDDVGTAAAWLCQAFGLRERLRIGNHRFQLSFGQGSVVAIERKELGTSSVLVHVDDIDSHYEHAKESGARIMSPPTDYPFGERQYTAEDIGGHRWTFSQTIADVDPGTWGGILYRTQIRLNRPLSCVIKHSLEYNSSTLLSQREIPQLPTSLTDSSNWRLHHENANSLYYQCRDSILLRRRIHVRSGGPARSIRHTHGCYRYHARACGGWSHSQFGDHLVVG